MTERTDAATAELEDALRRLLPGLLDDDDRLLASWALVLEHVPASPDAEDEGEGSHVDTVTRPGALVSHVLGALRVATLCVEDDLHASWHDGP